MADLGTCPTLDATRTFPVPPDDDLLGLLGASQESGDWKDHLLMAVGGRTDSASAEDENINGTIMPGTTLNTPTMEMAMDPFSNAYFNNNIAELSTAFNNPMDNNAAKVEDVWVLGDSPQPAEMLPVNPALIQEVGCPSSLDEGYCPSPDNTPMLNQAVITPASSQELNTPPMVMSQEFKTTPMVMSQEEFKTHELTTLDNVPVVLADHPAPVVKYEEPTNASTIPVITEKTTEGDLLSWIFNDTISKNSEMPGEVKEEEQEEVLSEFNVPTTIAVDDIDMTSIEPLARPAEEANTIGESSTPTPPQPRRKRGRPALPPGRAITPRVPRPPRQSVNSGDDESCGYMSTDGNLTDDDITKLKYRRMRDLNNEASKRCRENRKRKFQVLEDERDQLIAQNIKLRAKLQRLEGKVRELKSFYLTNIYKGREIPDAHMMWSKLGKMPDDF